MTIDFTKPELDAIVGLMDAGVKHSGLSAVRPVVIAVLYKIDEAVKTNREEPATT